MRKKIVSVVASVLLVLTILAASGCIGSADAADEGSTDSGNDSTYSGNESTNVDYSAASDAYISLDGDSIYVEGNGVDVQGTVATIISAGTYYVSGTLNDGQLRVNVGDDDTVTIVLDDADISCETSAALYVVNADDVILTLSAGSENKVADGKSYDLEDPSSNEPNAAVFSCDDLTINGSGTLEVTASYNNGIQSKDDLEIEDATIVVNAINNGIKGKDSVVITNADITVNAGGDGIQSDNEDDPEKGTVTIESSTISIESGEDGIQAETILYATACNLDISSGTAGSESGKGLKAGTDVTVVGGTMVIDSVDDAIHSNGSITIDGGTYSLSSEDDAMHSDASLTIEDGYISVIKSYEGLESSVITINGGTIYIVSDDDSINGSGESMQTDRADVQLYINGGYIVIDEQGEEDGIDINGSITMTGGTVIVHGPSVMKNAALDCDMTFDISGGYLLAAGSSFMAVAPTETSTQYSVGINFDSAFPEGTILRIESESGEDIATFEPNRMFESIVVSSSALKEGETYNVFAGGSATGTCMDGLYTDADYEGGTLVASFTISGMVTLLGEWMEEGGMPGGMGGGGMPGGMGGGGMPGEIPEDMEIPEDLPEGMVPPGGVPGGMQPPAI